jgi:hypothetical protein
MKLYYIDYFRKYPRDCIIEREIQGKLYRVTRPHYGIAYSSRQGFLVIDVVSIILMSPESSLCEWLRKKLGKDKLYIQKLFTLATFTESGRGDKETSEPNSDRINFIRVVNDYNLFEVMEHKKKWGSALMRDTNCKLTRILMTAYILDQQRLINFDIEKAKIQISELLEIRPNSNRIKILFNQASIYLHICGDIDMSINKSYYSDRFFILNDNYILLLELLNDAVYNLNTPAIYNLNTPTITC